MVYLVGGVDRIVIERLHDLALSNAFLASNVKIDVRAALGIPEIIDHV
jgi:hypothetical protein